MLSIYDYRNGRYQGHTKNNLPHGIGIFMHISLTFVIAEWSQGQLDGKVIVIFPDGSTFCSHFSQSSPKGASFYELSMDQIQILQIFDTNQEYKAAILLPLQSKIIQLSDQSYDIKKQYKIKENAQALELQDVAEIIGLGENYKTFYKTAPNCYTFFENYFCQKYPDIFEEIAIAVNGNKEYRIGFKEEGLGIKLQAVKQTLATTGKKGKNSTDQSKVQHRCLDGKVYMIREMGMISKDNNLTEYGLKSINELLKGYSIQQGIFQLPHTITKYHSTTQRPKVCAQTFANHLKRSFYYKNTFMSISVLEKIWRNKTIIQQDIVGVKKQLLAHSLIQKPNIRKQIEESQERNEEIAQQELKQKQMSPIKRGSFLNQNKNWSTQLQEVKKEIYNSVQLKKSNKKLPCVDYTNIKKLQRNQSFTIKKPQSPSKEVSQLSSPPVPRNEKSYIKNDSLTKEKSKNREYIELRKNGSITPRKKYNKPRQDKQKSAQKQVISPPKEQQRTTPGYILKTNKSKANIKASPIKQRISFRDSSQGGMSLLKNQKHVIDISVEKFVDQRVLPDRQKKYTQSQNLREKQSRSYFSRNKKKRLLNELDNFQL